MRRLLGLVLLVWLTGGAVGHATYTYTLTTSYQLVGRTWQYQGTGYLVLVAYDPEPEAALEPVYWAPTLKAATTYIKTELQTGAIHHAYVLATVGYGERALTESARRRP